MADLSHDDVRDIAELAKLKLSDDDVAMYAEQLTDILNYFTLLQEVDTSDVSALDSVMPMTSVMREDKASAGLSPDEATANAPDAEAHQFKVSAVLGDE